MNNKALTLSLAMALAAVMMVYSYIDSKEKEWAKRYGDESPVLVAKKDINELDQIREGMVEIQTIPKVYQEKNVYTSQKDVAGLIALIPLKKGEQVTFNKVGALGLRTGLSRQVSPGKRAISIPVNDVSAITKLLKPGDRIDVIAIVDPPGNQGKGAQIAKTILQDVPLLAVGKFISSQPHRRVERDDSGKEVIRNLHESDAYNTVTVEVDPQIAQTVAYMLNVPQVAFTLILRNNDDLERVNLSPTTLNDVLGSDPSRGVQRLPAAK